jgi:hypothetical protein
MYMKYLCRSSVKYLHEPYPCIFRKSKNCILPSDVQSFWQIPESTLQAAALDSLLSLQYFLLQMETVIAAAVGLLALDSNCQLLKL